MGSSSPPYSKSLEYVFFVRTDVTRVQLLQLEEYADKPVLAVALALRERGGGRFKDLVELLPNIPERELILALAVLALAKYVYALPEY